jgi:peptidoglycan/LPS O-acetylase OafA/YrhL
MFGCICALLLCMFGPRIRDLIRRSGPALAAAALALLAVTLAIRDPFFRATIRDSIQGLALCLAFFFFYGCSRGECVTRLLDSGAMRWMGKRSYAAYLWNFELVLAMSALGFAPATQPLPLRILLAIALVVATFGIAHLSYLFVYQPFAPLRRRFGSHHDVGVKDVKTSPIGLAQPATPGASQIGA